MRQYLLISVGVLLLVATGAGFFLFLRQPFFSIGSKSQTNKTSSVYHSNTQNIQFVVPTGWTVTDIRTPLPVGFENPIVSLKSDNSACVIIEAKNKNTREMPGKQVSFADRVFSSYSQFDGNWFVASTSATAQYTFSQSDRQYIPGEFRVSQNARNDPFVLFMSDGTPVPDDCSKDLNEILTTVEPYYEGATLTQTSKGTLTSDKVWDDVTPFPNSKTYTHLVFVDDAHGETREVMRLPAGTDPYGQFFVRDSKIYFPTNVSKILQNGRGYSFISSLFELDPFSKDAKEVPGTVRSDQYISSLFIRDRSAYYLASSSAHESCLQSSGSCPAGLYTVPVTGGEPTLLAHVLLGGSILGYEDNEKALYLRKGWGDAGCFNVSVSKVTSGLEEPVGRYGGCFGSSDTDNAEYEKELQSINDIKKRVSLPPSVGGVHVEGGTLTPLSGSALREPAFYFVQ